MRNLLSAGFHRLWRDKVFLISVLAVFLISVVAMLNGVRQALSAIANGFSRTLDDLYFFQAPMLGLYCAVFISLFIGTEHAEGIMRNKIVVGRGRTEIYLSNFIVCLTAGFCLVAAWLLGGLVGIPTLGLWVIGIKGLLFYILIALFITTALSSIFVLLCMLSTNKAVTAVIAILIAIALLLVSAYINNRLEAPEFLSGVVITSEGIQMGEPEANPSYLGGTMRTIFEFLEDCLPSGQGISMAQIEIGRPVLSLVSSAVITLFTLIIGIFAFRRKDLK